VRAPTVAVIVATRNRPRLLADALASVAAQRASPLEVRIANDGGVPVEDAVSASGLLEVTVLPTEMGNAGAARNLAATGARADLLAFLDDDDRWLPDHLEALMRAFREPACEIAFCDSAVVRERVEDDGRRVELGRRSIARPWDRPTMSEQSYVPPSALAVRRSLFEQLGGFDPAFRFSEDWDFLLRAAERATPLRVPSETVEVRLRDQGNASADAGSERRACLERLAARHGLPPLVIKTFWEVAGDLVATSPERTP